MLKNRCNNRKTAPSIMFTTLEAGKLYVKYVKNADGETRTRKGYAHTHLKRARIPIPPHPQDFNTD